MSNLASLFNGELQTLQKECSATVLRIDDNIAKSQVVGELAAIGRTANCLGPRSNVFISQRAPTPRKRRVFHAAAPLEAGLAVRLCVLDGMSIESRVVNGLQLL